MRSLLLHTLFFCTLVGFAQDRCATPDMDASRLVRFESWLEGKKAESLNKRQADVVYTIPVVVHVIHKGEAIGTGYNIPTQRILEQLEILNQDFRKANPRAGNVPAVFQSVEADVEIEFVLARQNPDGNPTTGIVRKQGSRSTYSYPNATHEAILKAESYWPSDDYLNIWVADISVLGWASFPVSNEFSDINDPETNPLLDGVVVDGMYMGINPNTGGSFESFGQTATHEIGHYLGLHHIFYGSCATTNDYCADTPAANNDNGGLDVCTYPGPDSCTSDQLADMFMNYMDYTDDACMNMFTNDQRFRMRTVLENSPRRTSLLNSPGLTYPIGTFDVDLAVTSIENLPLVLCPSSVDPTVTVANYGNDPITSFDLTYRINGVSSVMNVSGISLEIGELYQVEIPSQIVENKTNTFEFIVSDVNGSMDENELNDALNQLVYVNEDILTAPFREAFENQGNWITTTPDGTSDWLLEDGSMTAKGYGIPTNQQSWLISPTFSLADFSQAGLFFNLSYGLSDQTDLFDVRFALGCNGNFQLIRSIPLDEQNFQETSEEWQPADESSWKEIFVNLNALAGESEVRLAFVFTNKGGNNLYVDDIELVNNGNANQPRIKSGRFIAYPNPTKSNFTVTFNVPEQQPVRLQLIDLSGRIVMEQVYTDVLNQTYQVSTDDCYGTYFLRAKGPNIDQTQRILIGR